jgi:signal transduction histidine kinase
MDHGAVMSALGNLTLARLPDGRFVCAGALPSWCANLDAPALHTATPFSIAELFPFLTVFVDPAERAWKEGAPASSGFWVETAADGEVLHLVATALRIDDDALLIVCRREQSFADQQRILQRARELRLTHEELSRELEQKDVLLHALVHDLAGPLHRLLGTSALLLEQPLAAPLDEWACSLHDDLMQQQQTITAVLEAFSAELEEGSASSAAPVDLRHLIDDVVAVQQPVAKRRGVELEVAASTAGQVRADANRAQRVIDHLVGNAVYDSPVGTHVQVATHSDNGWWQLVVEDTRLPLPLEAVPRLFDRLGTVGAGPAAAIGLYYCRITAERWGGGIGYERTERGGRRFWVRFPRAQG